MSTTDCGRLTCGVIPNFNKEYQMTTNNTTTATSTSTVLNTRQSVDMILKSASFIAGLIPVTVRAAGNSIHQLDLTYANGQLSDSNYKDPLLGQSSVHDQMIQYGKESIKSMIDSTKVSSTTKKMQKKDLILISNY